MACVARRPYGPLFGTGVLRGCRVHGCSEFAGMRRLVSCGERMFGVFPMPSTRDIADRPDLTVVDGAGALTGDDVLAEVARLIADRLDRVPDEDPLKPDLIRLGAAASARRHGALVVAGLEPLR